METADHSPSQTDLDDEVLLNHHENRSSKVQKAKSISPIPLFEASKEPIYAEILEKPSKSPTVPKASPKDKSYST